jgi:hypothetical protein
MNPEWLAAQRDEYAGQLKAEHGPDVDVRAFFIEQTRKVIGGRDRTAYLRFGPYWWAVKRILIAASDATGRFGVLTREYELDNGLTFVLYDEEMEAPQ